MEKHLLAFLVGIVICASGAILGAIATKFNPLAAFTVFAIVAGIWLGLTDKKPMRSDALRSVHPE